MKSIWLQDNQISLRDDVPVPQPTAGEALIQLRLMGICSTDLEMVKGYYPFTGVLGHEFVGDVVSAPGNAGWEGKRVTGEINISCGDCHACRHGMPTHCENRSVLGILNHHGAFAEYLTLPVRNLHLVPDTVSDQEAVFTEPLAAALEILQQVAIKPDQQVLLIGAGRLGQMIAQTLSMTGGDLRVVARHRSQQSLLEAAGIRWIREQDVRERSVDLVVEASGSALGFELARKSLRPRGTMVLKSTFKGNLEVNFSALVVDEITLIGSRCGPFEPALRVLAEKKVNPLGLIETSYPLVQGEQALAHAAQAGVLKVLLVP